MEYLPRDDNENCNRFVTILQMQFLPWNIPEENAGERLTFLEKLL